MEIVCGAWYNKRLAIHDKVKLEREGFTVKMFWNGRAWAIRAFKI